MITYERAIITLSAILFIALGTAFLLWPAAMAAVVEITVSTPTAITDLRAVYGGMNLALGVYFATSIFSEARRKAALLALFAIFTGLAATRVFGIAVDGAQRPITYLLLAGEVIGLILTAIARWRFGQPHRRAST